MLKLSARIEITGEKKWVFEKITACEIVSSVFEPSDFCKLTLPRKVKWQGETSNPIRRGDKISVWLGYDDNLQLAFSGYVRSVSVGSPCILDCEDEFFLYHNPQDVEHVFNIACSPLHFLRSLGYNGNGIDTSHIHDITNYEAGEVDGFLNSVYSGAKFITKQSGCAVKFIYDEDSNSKYLIVFDSLEDNAATTLVLSTEVNIISTKNLKFTAPEDSKAFVKCGSLESCYLVDSAPVYHEYQLGDDIPGASRIIAKPEGWPERSVKNFVEYYYEILTRGGLSGSIVTFGNSLINITDKVAVKLYGEKMGIYSIDRIKIYFGSKGFHQEITLGIKLSD